MGMENTLMMSEDDETSDDTDYSDVDALFRRIKKPPVQSQTGGVSKRLLVSYYNH